MLFPSPNPKNRSGPGSKDTTKNAFFVRRRKLKFFCLNSTISNAIFWFVCLQVRLLNRQIESSRNLAASHPLLVAGMQPKTTLTQIHQSVLEPIANAMTSTQAGFHRHRPSVPALAPSPSPPLELALVRVQVPEGRESSPAGLPSCGTRLFSTR